MEFLLVFIAHSGVSVLGVTRRFFSLSPVFECPFSNYKPYCKEK